MCSLFSGETIFRLVLKPKAMFLQLNSHKISKGLQEKNLLSLYIKVKRKKKRLFVFNE